MKPLPRGLFIGGLVLCLMPLLGFIFTVFGMVSAFQTLGRAGVSDPSILAENINVALLSAVAGLLAAGVGVILLVIATILHFTDWPKKVDSTLVTEKH